MMKIRKDHGFDGEKFLVVPYQTIQELTHHPLIDPLYITDIGYFPHAKYHFYERTSGCPDNIMIVCLEGKGRIEGSDTSQIVTGGWWWLIPAGVPHVYEADNDDPWSILWVHFNGYKGKDYVSYCTSKTDTIYGEQLPVEILGHLIPLLQEIYRTLERGLTVDHGIYASQVFSHALGLLGYARHPDGLHRKDIINVDHVIQLMQQRLDQSISLKELAVHASLSKTQLIHLFKQSTGRTPIDFFLHMKIQQACRLLEYTDKEIQEVAQSVGISDPYYFSRLFRKVMGMPPKEYRLSRK